MIKYTNEDYKKLLSDYSILQRQYKVDLDKKIQLEKKYKIKTRQLTRLEKTISNLEQTIKDYSKIFDAQTDIAIMQNKTIDNIVTLTNSLLKENKISAEVATQILNLIDTSVNELHD